MNNPNSTPIVLLVDTGADISLIKLCALDDNFLVYPHLKCKITGITPESQDTLGCSFSTLYFPNRSVKQKFHVVPSNFPLPCDGIIGKDFLVSYKCKIDFSIMTLEIGNALEDDADSIVVNLIPSYNVPARSEIYMKIKTNYLNDTEFYCPSQMVKSGVYIANSIIKVQENHVILCVLNSNSADEYLNGSSIKLEPISNYNLCSLSQSDIYLENRLTKLENEIDLSELNEEEYESIIKIIHSFNDVFYLPGDKLSCTSVVKHSIPLESNCIPIHSKQYRLPESSKFEIKRKIPEMLKDGIIKNSSSPWNSPLLIVPKTSGGQKKFRLVVDFRKLNQITIGDSYPLPNISEILDQLGKANYFSTLDLANGFHQIMLDPKDSCKTAFSTGTGHYEFLRMPFGLKNAPSTFQRLMNNVLIGLNEVKCFVYLDDIVVYGYDLLDHNNRLYEVLTRLKKHNLKLQPSKCFFLRREICYLGHIISSDGVRPDPSKIEVIEKFPKPQNPKEIKSFLGFVGYYRRFIKNFANLAEPLNNLLRKETQFDWCALCENSFTKLKSYLVKPPILQFPDFEKRFYLTTDASDIAVGAVLSQLHGKNEYDLPIAYASRSLNSTERKYSVIERELLAIVCRFYR